MSYQILITKKPIRTLRMSIKSDGIVRVSAPRRMSDKQIHERIDSKKPWIDSVLTRLASKKPPTLSPDQFQLWGEIRTIDRTQTASRRGLDDEGKKLWVSPTSTITPARRLRQYATWWLKKRLAGLSTQHGLSYKKVFIRAQTTKRGTCSSKQHIGLNRKLIQFPVWVIDYVICHELAHLVHMDHSAKFRSLTRSLYPRTDEAKKRLREHGQIAVG